MDLPPDKNQIFYHNIATHDNYLYRLYFIPGDVNYLSSPIETELPHFIVEKDGLLIKNNYADNMPVGLPEISEMELTINLNNFTNTDITWSYLRDWILLRKSDSTSDNGDIGAVNGKNIYIPNQWIVKRSNDNGSTWQIIFHGIQEQTADRKLDKTGIFNFKCLGLLESALKETDINLSNAYITGYKGAVYNFIYNYLGVVPVVIGSNFSDGFTGSEFRMYYTDSNNTFDTAFVYEIMETLKAFTRYSTASLSIDNPLKNWTFYEIDTDSTNAQIGASLGLDEVILIHKVTTQAGEIVGGLTTDNESPHCWKKEFINFYAFFNSVYAGLLAKGKYSFGNTDVNFSITCEPVLGSGASWSFTNVDFLDSDELLNNDGVQFQAAITHIPNLSDNETNEYTYSNDNRTQDNATFEVEMKLHNQIMLGVEETSTFFGASGTLTDFTAIQGLYYTSGDILIRIHDFCIVAIDNATSISSDDISTFEDLPLPGDGTDAYNAWITLRMLKSGLGYTLAKAAHYAFCNENQYFLNGTINIEYASPQTLGLCHSIDINSFFEYDLPANYDNDSANCILTSIECDIINNQSKCIWFLRGDRV